MRNKRRYPYTRISIRQKLVLSFLLLVFVIITVFSVSSYLREKEISRRGIEKHGLDVIRLFTRMAVMEAGREGDFTAFLENARQLAADGEITSIAVFDSEGRAVVRTDPGSSSLKPFDNFHREAIRKGKITQREILTGTHGAMEFVSPFFSRDGGRYLIRMEMSLKPLQMGMMKTNQRLFFLSAGLIILAVVLAILLSEILAEPIHKLLEGTKQMAEGNLSYRIDIEASDEIGELAASFNEMGAKLKDNFDQISRQHHEKAVAETASKAKSEFLANMSHEIRTPLNAVSGFMALALKGELKEKERQYLEKAMASTRLLLSIINDILDFSKIEAGKLELESTPFQLNEVLNTLHDLFAGKASDKGVELIVDVETDVPRSLIGDPLRLGQILTNLTSNALKFTERGEIFIRVVLLKKVREKEVNLLFSVKDTGIGIAPDRLSRLFSPFTQADESTTRKFGGTGLGLTISKRLTEIMGGKIWAESTPGIGSKFYFQIPFGCQEIEKTKPLLLPETLHGLRVLVIDDNKSSRNFLTRTLREFGMEAMSVSSGHLAVRDLKRKDSDRSFDLLLIDQRMPSISGVKVARDIRDECQLTDIPIIMMTKYGRESVLRKSDRDVKIDGFIFKPVRKEMLFSTILEVFHHGSGQIAENADQDDAEARADTEKLKGRRVLVVEDNFINQQVALEILESVGILVEIAGNGQRAIDLFSNGGKEERRNLSELYDAILMDIQMPYLDGLQTSKILRERGVHTPIIAITAHALKGNREKCHEAGMDDFVAKPFEPETIYQTLTRWIK